MASGFEGVCVVGAAFEDGPFEIARDVGQLEGAERKPGGWSSQRANDEADA